MYTWARQLPCVWRRESQYLHAPPSQVQPEWRPVVDAAVEACRSVLGEHLVSVYLRGSIPQGAAVAGLTDCDCLVYYSDWAGDRRQGLATPTATRLLQQELRARAAGVAALHPFCTKVHPATEGNSLPESSSPAHGPPPTADSSLPDGTAPR